MVPYKTWHSGKLRTYIQLKCKCRKNLCKEIWLFNYNIQCNADLNGKFTERVGVVSIRLKPICNNSPSIKRIQPWITEILVFKKNLKPKHSIRKPPIFQIHDINIKITKPTFRVMLLKMPDQYLTTVPISKESNFGLRNYRSLKTLTKISNPKRKKI